MSSARLARHSRLSGLLAALTDRELIALLPAFGSSLGGTTGTLELDGETIFVKSVPLTDLERRHERSTANLFELPNCYHYGVGSTGFGAWRELAVHDQTTAWVVAGECGKFPLMHHWRVLPGATVPSEDLETAVKFWDGSLSVRARLEALERSTARIVLFLEHFPRTLGTWLREAPIETVERELLATCAFMSARGLVHFDAHFENILTDGHALYFSDFGLALSAKFELSESEAGFLATHAHYDRNYTASRLVNALGGQPARFKSIAELMNPFFHALQTTRRTTPYPADALDRAWP